MANCDGSEIPRSMQEQIASLLEQKAELERKLAAAEKDLAEQIPWDKVLKIVKIVLRHDTALQQSDSDHSHD